MVTFHIFSDVLFVLFLYNYEYSLLLKFLCFNDWCIHSLVSFTEWYFPE